MERARIASKRKQATEEGRVYANEWTAKKRRDDPSWKIKAHMRVLVGRALKGRKSGRSWREFLPYTLDELMRHIERQFLPGMTWENRGEWHIDHILPLSSFEFSGLNDPEFQAAWALTNLRPLWAKDNIRKNATRTHLI